MPVESGLHRVQGLYEALPLSPNVRASTSMQSYYGEDQFEIRVSDGGPCALFGSAPLHKPLQTLRSLA